MSGDPNDNPFCRAPADDITPVIGLLIILFSLIFGTGFLAGVICSVWVMA